MTSTVSLSLSILQYSVAIDASSYGFQFYSKGVYTDDSCSQSKLNHGVLVTGYGVSSNQAYWHVKNRWDLYIFAMCSRLSVKWLSQRYDI